MGFIFFLVFAASDRVRASRRIVATTFTWASVLDLYSSWLKGVASILFREGRGSDQNFLYANWCVCLYLCVHIQKYKVHNPAPAEKRACERPVNHLLHILHIRLLVMQRGEVPKAKREVKENRS